MIELRKRHTAAAIKESIDGLLHKFAIEPWQLYTAAVRELRELQRENREVENLQESLRNCEDNDCEDFDDSDDDGDDDIMDSVESVTKMLGEHEIVCVRCGAHTLNLVVVDVTKRFSTTLTEVVSIVKTFRKVDYKDAYKLNQQKYPPIPNVTRWNAYVALM